MVLGQILKIGSTILKHRRTIYTVLTAQDRYIDKAMKIGRYGKAARYGVRHGALGGSLVGSLISQDSPTEPSAFQKRKFPKTNKFDKTYSRRFRGTKQYKQQQRYRCRCPKPRSRYI